MGSESRRYRRSLTGKSAAPVTALAIPDNQNTEANHEAEISKGVGPVADIRDVDSNRGTVDNRACVAESTEVSGCESQPHVATATRGQIVDLATERKRRRKVATVRQPHVAMGKPYIEAVKASKGTWAFRLRWYENGARVKPIYISRVADSVYEIIRRGDYEAFKKQLIGSHSAGAVRASH